MLLPLKATNHRFGFPISLANYSFVEQADMLEKIQAQFNESIQTQIQMANEMPPILNECAQRIVQCLLSDNKIIVCGHGRSYINAQLLVSYLLHRYQLARPSFAAQLLHFDGVLAGVMVEENELAHLYSKQLQAIGKEGDLFITFSPSGNEQAVLNASHAAKNIGMNILAFSSSRNDHTKGLLDDHDLEIIIPSHNEARILESHQFCVNLLGELIDSLLFS